MKDKTHYIEVHKAKTMYSITRNVMDLVDKTALSSVLKNTIKTDLNKIIQFLTLKNLKTLEED